MGEEFDLQDKKNQAADGLATASLVLGIISLFSTLCCCPFVFSALGIIMALLSKGAEKMLRPRAKTGLMLSIIGMVMSIVITVFTIALPVFMFETNPEYKKNVLNIYEESIEENEDTFRQIYGDEVYEQMLEFVEELKK